MRPKTHFVTKKSGIFLKCFFAFQKELENCLPLAANFIIIRPSFVGAAVAVVKADTFVKVVAVVVGVVVTGIFDSLLPYQNDMQTFSYKSNEIKNCFLLQRRLF